MRTALFLAIALLAMPATAQQQPPTPAPSIAPEAEQSARTPPERRSLMGAVMGLLIQSAEQASADQASELRAAQEPELGVDGFNAPRAPALEPTALEPPALEAPARETREVAVHAGSGGIP
ncbi:MAG TPA: hypothetical protein VFR30_10715 [Lysobacter sp.]|nr:hypothetical protein [Lysobacter sp.]